LIPIFLCLVLQSSAQDPSKLKKHANIWYFGAEWSTLTKSAVLDFSSGTPVAYTAGKYIGSEGNTTLCDSSGNFYAYAIGEFIINAIHDTMQNGAGLLGSESSSQGSLVIPKPGSNTEYYLFTTDAAENSGLLGLRYSLIDMTLNGGLGGVDSTEKNVLLHAPTTEKLTAVHHCNGKDIWVLMHENFSNKFYAYLVTSADVDTVPVISAVGNVHNHEQGCMKFSPDGKKLALAIPDPNLLPESLPQLFDFDNAMGNVSKPITLPIDSGAFGVSFSPDGTKLYIGAGPYKLLFQFDLTSNDSADIVSSKVLLYTNFPGNIPNLQLATDGKIYGATAGTIDSMHVINNPNETGFACDFQRYGVYLNGGESIQGLINTVESYFNETPFAYGVHAGYTWTDNILMVSFTDTSHNANTWYWTFGDGNTDTVQNPVHTYSDTGAYQVCLVASSACGVDTSCVAVIITATGIDEYEQNANIEIYPNPANEKFIVSLGVDVNEKTTIHLYNMSGQEVITILHPKTNPIEINTEKLTEGTYLIKIQTGKQTLKKKFIKIE